MEIYLIISVAGNIALVGSDMACNDASNLCSTRGCINAASSILNNMDPSVDPCDDFYQFACGNFIKRTIIAFDNYKASPFDFTRELVQQQLRVILKEKISVEEPHPFKILKKIYQACMNTTAIELDSLTTINSILQELGGWPVLEGRKWDQQKFDWKKSVYKFRNFGYNSNHFISVETKVYIKNSSLNVLYIGSPDVSRSNSSDLKLYLNKMVNVATALGAKKRVAERGLNNTIKFERHLSMIASPFSLVYHRMSVSELQQKIPNIPWLEYLNSVLNVPNITITSSDVIMAAPPLYFLDLEKLLNNTPKRIQANYLMWKVIESSIPYLTQKLSQNNELSKLRWKTCVKLTLESMPIATGALYVRNHFHEDTKQTAMEMVSNIRNEFANMVKRAEWMDDVTKQHALEKIAAMSFHIAYPEEFPSDEKLEDFYKGLHVESDNFLKIRLSTKLFDYDNAAKRLLLPLNQSEWVEYGRSININAYYNRELNRIMLPAAIQQGVFFSNDRPWYMNYGGLGVIIAHEIIHGFDNHGRKHDKFGNLKDWWEPFTNAEFITKAQCIIDQYGNHSIPKLGININGSKTQGENIADNGGVRNAYLAYNEWVRNNGKEPLLPGLNYTDRQLFWISAANVACQKMEPSFKARLIHTDVHSPAKFRINIPLSNTNYFAKDFNCRLGSKMNPVIKCKVWRFF